MHGIRGACGPYYVSMDVLVLARNVSVNDSILQCRLEKVNQISFSHQ